ncbi:YncE family protein [Pedobacter soli]|uniref:40-residue YVTN family beta-propeller repeat-containing protein n=1 Tax=Pedobacter soli TaxID=390242 RepID=A0A1G6IEE2_9SPHI|nr:YncE family protein [Pedobacter soli]SDC04927.1 hypothetical protein SAMN04488024_101130 [Pedobacter soli]
MKHQLQQVFKRTGLLLLTALAFACRKDTPVDEDSEQGAKTPSVTVKGLYVLNEGNWGSNKSSLDYYNYEDGKYTRNIFGAANPAVTLGLGDVGNDIKIYGAKMYVVVNGSNKVEILNAGNAKQVAKLDINNPRYVTFYKNFAYITSYDGYVAVVDTTALSTIKTKITVGNQPEEMAVVGNKLYVANSGGYNYPNYDRTVSVIDLTTNTETKKIDVAINLHHLKADKYGDIYVTSRGDYGTVASSLYVIDSQTDAVKKNFNIPVSDFWINEDDAYLFSYSYATSKSTYVKLNVKDETVASNNFIADGVEASITLPYGIAVDPTSGDIFVTDARDYVTPGTIYCFDKAGKKKFTFTTGDIPAHIAFLLK